MIRAEPGEFINAVQAFWKGRQDQQTKQAQVGKPDAGSRGAATGGRQFNILEDLLREHLTDAGVDDKAIRTRSGIELPGYYRPEKKWDLLVVESGRLLAAIELKSHVGPSFGNNANNRAEEAIGSASDIWLAYREGRFGAQPQPFLGYFFLLEDCPEVHSPVTYSQPHFPVDIVFEGASYAKRYEVLCRRLVMERLYAAACLTLSTNTDPTQVTHPSEDLSFQRFASQLTSHSAGFL